MSETVPPELIGRMQNDEVTEDVLSAASTPLDEIAERILAARQE